MKYKRSLELALSRIERDFPRLIPRSGDFSHNLWHEGRGTRVEARGPRHEAFKRVTCRGEGRYRTLWFFREEFPADARHPSDIRPSSIRHPSSIRANRIRRRRPAALSSLRALDVCAVIGDVECSVPSSEKGSRLRPLERSFLKVLSKGPFERPFLMTFKL